MRTVEGRIPTRAKAIGNVRTPPPHTVATRLKMDDMGEDCRRMELDGGFRNSKDGCLRRMELKRGATCVGQNVDSRFNNGSKERDESMMDIVCADADADADALEPFRDNICCCCCCCCC